MKKWLEVIPNVEQPDLTTFRCRICSKYYDELLGIPDQKPKIATAEGVNLKLVDPIKLATLNLPKDRKNYLAKIEAKNRDKFREHIFGTGEKKGASAGTSRRRSGIPIHSKVIEKLESQHHQGQQRLETDAEIVEEVNRNPIQLREASELAATCNMMRLVYAECKLNVPFMSHGTMVSVVEKSGGNIGIHHRDRMASIRMLTSIGSYMHFKLLNHLQQNIYKNPMSFIVDGSTTYQGEHYLITYIRTLENVVDPATNVVVMLRPMVYFYKLIALDEVSETGEVHMQKISKALEDDRDDLNVDMPRIFKNSVVAFGSDGASVMSSRGAGLIKHMSDYVEKPLIFVHCMAHRLQLAIGKSWKLEDHFQSTEDLLNTLHKYYFGHGHKRRIHFEKVV